MSYQVFLKSSGTLCAPAKEKTALTIVDDSDSDEVKDVELEAAGKTALEEAREALTVCESLWGPAPSSSSAGVMEAIAISDSEPEQTREAPQVFYFPTAAF